MYQTPFLALKAHHSSRLHQNGKKIGKNPLNQQ